MKKRFDIFLEAAHFPLIAVFIATIMLGTGNLLLNTHMSMLGIETNKTILLISAFLRTCGSFIIQNFPLLLLYYILTRKYDDTAAGIMGVVSYIVLLITTMFFASSKLPSNAYASILGLRIDGTSFSSLSGSVRYPLNIGVFATLICYFTVRFSYNKTRNRRTYGMMAFIDKNTMSLLLTIIFSIIMGLVTSYVWPHVINGLYNIFAFIADDITNPFNLFVYGITEKLMGVCNMIEVPRSIFWFGEYGGSWLDSFGRKFAGDVSIWTAQMASSSLTSGIGRFITPLYLIQIFAIPGYLGAMFSLYTNRFEKRKYILFLILCWIVSIFMGTSLPFDIFMICSTPLLFGIHVFISGVLYALLQWSKIFIGFTYTGTVAMASPGSLADLFVYFNSPMTFKSIQVLFGIGLFVFVLYFVITRLYYRYLAIDMFQSGEQRELIEQVVNALGGIENIRVIDSNPLKILVQVHDETKVDITKLRNLCNSKVFESKTGYVLYFYKASHAIHIEISRLLKAGKSTNLMDSQN